MDRSDWPACDWYRRRLLLAAAAVPALSISIGAPDARPLPSLIRRSPPPLRTPLLAVRPIGATPVEQATLDRLAQRLDDLMEAAIARLDAGDPVDAILNDPHHLQRQDDLLAQRRAILDAIAERQV